MKKIISVLFVSLLCLSLAACGGGGSKPDGMSDDAYAAGKNLLEVTKAYISGDKTASEAYEKADDLVSRFSGKDHNTEMLGMTAQSLAREFLSAEPDLDAIKKERDDVKSYLGE